VDGSAEFELSCDLCACVLGNVSKGFIGRDVGLVGCFFPVWLMCVGVDWVHRGWTCMTVRDRLCVRAHVGNGAVFEPVAGRIRAVPAG
jgi:hypothetical protein